MAIIPPELIDAVLDFLHDDRVVLYACAVVCKAWLPSCRFHLFSCILLHTWNAQKFSTLLDSPLHTSAITPYVRSLYLLEGRGRDSTGPPWLNKGVLRIAALTSVTKLQLEYLKWEELEDDSRTALASILPRLEELHFLHSYFETFGQLVDLICICRSLRRLRLEVNPMVDEPAVELEKLPSPGSLQGLDLDSYHCDNTIRWLLMHEHSYANLTTLIMRSVYQEHVPSLARFLRALGRTLRFFNVGVRMIAGVEGQLPHLFVTSC
jgi:hypothetical protein